MNTRLVSLLVGLLIAGHGYALTILCGPWEAAALNMDFIGVVRCTVPGISVSRCVVEDSYYGAANGTILDFQLSGLSKDSRFLVFAFVPEPQSYLRTSNLILGSETWSRPVGTTFWPEIQPDLFIPEFCYGPWDLDSGRSDWKETLGPELDGLDAAKGRIRALLESDGEFRDALLFAGYIRVRALARIQKEIPDTEEAGALQHAIDRGQDVTTLARLLLNCIDKLPLPARSSAIEVIDDAPKSAAISIEQLMSAYDFGPRTQEQLVRAIEYNNERLDGTGESSYREAPIPTKAEIISYRLRIQQAIVIDDDDHTSWDWSSAFRMLIEHDPRYVAEFIRAMNHRMLKPTRPHSIHDIATYFARYSPLPLEERIDALLDSRVPTVRLVGARLGIFGDDSRSLKRLKWMSNSRSEDFAFWARGLLFLNGDSDSGLVLFEHLRDHGYDYFGGEISFPLYAVYITLVQHALRYEIPPPPQFPSSQETKVWGKDLLDWWNHHGELHELHPLWGRYTPLEPRFGKTAIEG